MVKKRENEKGIEECLSILNEVSKGNLTKTMLGEYEGSFETIKNAINQTILKLKNMLDKIYTSTDMISKSIQQISLNGESLSERTEKQSTMLQESAASLEEISSLIRQNAETMRTTADNSKNISEKGGVIVKNTLDGMRKITDNSKQITEIITLIDEIAFQTMILSFNTSIEAARIGGTGFSVISKEIRDLATRSKTASQNIKEIISTSSQLIQNGSHYMDLTGENLNEIITSTDLVAQHVTNITLASKEQLIGVEQINISVAELESLNQQNTLMVYNNVKETNELKNQIDLLTRIVKEFSV
jgi:methyl-accepting chemotaxis protein